MDVSTLIEAAIGDDWSVTNDHGVELRRALIPPRKVTVIERTVIGGDVVERKILVWQVLVERPETDDGYRIVMKEDEPMFGLAVAANPTDAHLVLTGWYGDFMTTFQGM